MAKDRGTDVELPDIPAKLGSPARRARSKAGLTELAHLAMKTMTEIAALHGIGPNAVKQLEAALRSRGLSFAQEAKR